MKSILKSDHCCEPKFIIGTLVRSCPQFYNEDFIVLIALITDTRFKGIIIWVASTTNTNKLADTAINFKFKNFNKFKGTIELTQ